jgi:spore maturation protein CgeB
MDITQEKNIDKRFNDLLSMFYDLKSTVEISLQERSAKHSTILSYIQEENKVMKADMKKMTSLLEQIVTLIK